MTTRSQAKREAKKLFKLCFVDGRLDADVADRVTRLIGGASRRGAGLILKHVERLVKIDRAEHTAQVESAAPMPADMQSAITARLASRYGGGLATMFTQRPELIGGVRIQVGSNLYDGSVRAALETLDRTF